LDVASDPVSGVTEIRVAEGLYLPSAGPDPEDPRSGNPRFADDPATADAGCGVPVVVDLGAYELQAIRPESCLPI
jgi:hypothetical protein